jgi:subtilisin family serine protease
MSQDVNRDRQDEDNNHSYQDRKGDMRRSILTLLSVFALAIAVLAPIGAAGAADPQAGLDLASQRSEVERSPSGSYIVVMSIEPLLADFDQDQLNSKPAQKKAKGFEKSHDETLEAAGVDASAKTNDYVNAVNGFSAIMSHEDAQNVALQKDVAFVMPDELRQVTTDSSPAFLGLTDAAGAWQTGYTGEGVIIGVIDTGIWPEHPSFADDGSYPTPPIALDDSVISACDFGNSAHNADDADFECNNKLIGARQMLSTYRAVLGANSTEFDSARDDDGHGTHTASTSGGNADISASILGIDRGVITGIAPRAHIVAYEGLGSSGGFGSDLAAAIDQAVFDGADVINYSVGGGASLTGTDDIAFLFAADAGVYVATSNGNSGPGPFTVGGPASVPWLTSVGASTQARKHARLREVQFLGTALSISVLR